MRFRYSMDFRCGIAVFANFLCGIAVLSTPQSPPQNSYMDFDVEWTKTVFISSTVFNPISLRFMSKVQVYVYQCQWCEIAEKSGAKGWTRKAWSAPSQGSSHERGRRQDLDHTILPGPALPGNFYIILITFGSSELAEKALWSLLIYTRYKWPKLAIMV